LTTLPTLQVGPVSSVHMPKDKVTGKQQGYGFVEFKGEEDADYAIKVACSWDVSWGGRGHHPTPTPHHPTIHPTPHISAPIPCTVLVSLLLFGCMQGLEWRWAACLRC
jgi:hypothetical protein